MSFVAVAITGFTALNAIQQGKAANAQAGLQARQSEYQAQVERETALRTAQIIRKAGRRQLGQTVAGYAGAGVRVDEGSAVDVQEQVTKDVEHDAFHALLDGDRRARGLQTDATLTRIEGDMRQQAGYVNAVGSVLQGGYSAMRSNGWRTAGPGFSGTQAPAPVTTLTPRMVGS